MKSTTVSSAKLRTSMCGSRLPEPAGARPTSIWQDAAKTPVTLYTHPEDPPDAACVQRLLDMARHPRTCASVVALPDVFYKGKNTVPGGTAVAVAGAVVPTFTGVQGDALALVGTGLRHDGDPKAIQAWLTDVMAELRDQVAPFRRHKPALSPHTAQAILAGNRCAVASDLADMFGVSVGWVPIPKLHKLCSHPDSPHPHQAFSAVRPAALPRFVPEHDPIQAAMRAVGVLDGNSHFLEISTVAEVCDATLAAQAQLDPEEIVIALHAGSGDVGLCAHRQFLTYPHGAVSSVVDASPTSPPLSNPAVHQASAGAVVDSTLLPGTSSYRRFWQATLAAENVARLNRWWLAQVTMQALLRNRGAAGLQKVSKRNWGKSPIRWLSDVSHDGVSMAAAAAEQKQGARQPVLHRKGAALALPGEPFVLPSSPGQDSYVMCHPTGHPATLFTCAHGAGRQLEMETAAATLSSGSLQELLHQRRIVWHSLGKGSLASQAPGAFKPMHMILQAVERFALATPIARLRPLALLKP